VLRLTCRSLDSVRHAPRKENYPVDLAADGVIVSAQRRLSFVGGTSTDTYQFVDYLNEYARDAK
jgi:hypothetical protein